MYMRTKPDLKVLKSTDVYSLVLFALYQLSGIEEYSTLSELAYVLKDKESLYNLLDYFGGVTIRIPTRRELQTIINALLIYQCVKLEGDSFGVAVNKVGDIDSLQLKEIKQIYGKLCDILDKFYEIDGQQ